MPKSRLVVALTIILLMNGCSGNLNATLAPFIPTVIPLTEVYGVMPTRYKISENMILVTAEFKGIKFTKETDSVLDSRRVQLAVHFKNVSTNPIVFRKPISYGFVGSDGGVNDLAIFVEMKNGQSMNVTSTSNYPHQGEFSPFPKITQEDFITIEPNNVFSYPLEVAPPPVYIEETNYGGKLPAGKYKLRVEYTNYDIGYDLPLEVTPPASFENSQARTEWYSNHTMVVDLNAWVGHIWSNELEFALPADR